MKKILLIVDPQIDFINGALPVPGAEAAMNDLVSYVSEHDGQYFAKIITCDFHPYNHCSFITNGGQWPEHCIAHSVGAAIWPSLLKSLHLSKGKVDIFCKGECAEVEEYSIFQNQKAKIKLQTIISETGTTQIDICGLAGDICVLNTLRDGVEIFGSSQVSVLKQFSPSLDGGVKLNDYTQRL